MKSFLALGLASPERNPQQVKPAGNKCTNTSGRFCRGVFGKWDANSSTCLIPFAFWLGVIKSCDHWFFWYGPLFQLYEPSLKEKALRWEFKGTSCCSATYYENSAVIWHFWIYGKIKMLRNPKHWAYHDNMTPDVTVSKYNNILILSNLTTYAFFRKTHDQFSKLLISCSFGVPNWVYSLGNYCLALKCFIHNMNK